MAKRRARKSTEEKPAEPEIVSIPVHPAEVEGVCCPNCSCRHLIALYTRHYGNRTVRSRRCRHCGKVVQTTERITNENPKRRAS